MATTTNPQVVTDEDFEFANENPLTTNGWVTPTGTTAARCQVYGGVVIGVDDPCIAWQSTGIPDDPDQMIQATVFSHKEGTADQYAISLYARLDDDVTATTYNAATPMPAAYYELRLEYLSASNVRNLRIYRHDRVGAAIYTIVDSTAVTLVTENGVAASGGNDLGVMQDLRFAVTDDKPGGGVRLRAWVNNDDDENPDIEYLDLGTDDGTGSITIRDAGLWGFGIRDATGASVGVDYFYAYDKYGVEKENIYTGRTLEQLRVAVQDECYRGSGGNVPTAYIDRQINYAQQDVMANLGRLAWFLDREGSFVLSSDDEGKTVEFPPEVEMVHDIMASPSRRPVSFRVLGQNAKGTALRVRMGENPASRTFLVHYQIRWDELKDADDRCVVPRQFDEVVVLAAAIRIARRSGDSAWEQSIGAHYAAALNRMKKYINTQKRQQKMAFRTKSIGSNVASDLRYVGDRSELWPWWW